MSNIIFSEKHTIANLLKNPLSHLRSRSTVLDSKFFSKQPNCKQPNINGTRVVSIRIPFFFKGGGIPVDLTTIFKS
jgi:hypothetical protein